MPNVDTATERCRRLLQSDFSELEWRILAALSGPLDWEERQLLKNLGHVFLWN